MHTDDVYIHATCRRHVEKGLTEICRVLSPPLYSQKRAGVITPATYEVLTRRNHAKLFLLPASPHVLSDSALAIRPHSPHVGVGAVSSVDPRAELGGNSKF